jgi:hypothetical protein
MWSALASWTGTRLAAMLAFGMTLLAIDDKLRLPLKM